MCCYDVIALFVKVEGKNVQSKSFLYLINISICYTESIEYNRHILFAQNSKDFDIFDLWIEINSDKKIFLSIFLYIQQTMNQSKCKTWWKQQKYQSKSELIIFEVEFYL